MIEYLKNEEVKALIDAAPSYQKSALTSLRAPESSELGHSFNTYVLKDGALRVESTNTISDDVVVARNSSVIGQIDGKDIYNEWLIPKATAIKNYGESVVSGLGHQFTDHKKQATLKAIELTPEIMKKLGVEGDILNIQVSWSKDPMIAHVGDYLSSGGYSVSQNDMKDYELVVSNVNNKIKELRSNLSNSNTSTLKP